MVDFGRSDDPRVQAQLDRLSALSVPQGRFGLETIRALMERLGNPHRKLPPVFHVAGTNGKGSTCAFLRSMLEAQGYSVHVTTSPHLVRYNERIRLAGTLISDETLAGVLKEVLDRGSDLGPSFFEVTIAAAFLAFSRTPADVCVVEVGLGGRFDATNVLEPEAVAVSGIAALGLDHEQFLLAPEDGVPTVPIARIAFEKAGIAKPGVPLVTLGNCYPGIAQAAIRDVARDKNAQLHEGFLNFFISDAAGYYVNDYGEDTSLNPALKGEHQLRNAGLAIAMLLNQEKLAISQQAIVNGINSARWPARLQLLSDGPLRWLVPDQALWLDGGHNPNAGAAIAEHFKQPVHLILGMLTSKDPKALIEPLADRIRSLSIVPVPGHDAHGVDAFGPDARACSDLSDALLHIPGDGHPVLIAGSLYLAGEALALNDELPD